MLAWILNLEFKAGGTPLAESVYLFIID